MEKLLAKALEMELASGLEGLEISYHALINVATLGRTERRIHC